MTLRTRILRVLTIVGMTAAALLGTMALSAPAQADTFYEIVGLASNKCVDIRAQDSAYGARAQLYQCHGKPNQRFTFQQVGTTPGNEPYFRIVNARGLCLQVRDASRADGAQVDQGGCSSDAHQYWKWGTFAAGVSLPLINMNSGKCLDVNANSTANGARIQQWTCNNSFAQLWRTVR